MIAMRRLRIDRRGVVSLEFAMTAPVLLLLCLATFEAGYALQAKARVNIAAQNIASLVASQDAISAAAFQDVCTAGRIMLGPLPTSGLKITVASMSRAAQTTVLWQDTSCGNGTAMANAVSTSTGLMTSAGEGTILVHASYDYRSPLAFVMPSTMTITGEGTARPRNNDVVARQ